MDMFIELFCIFCLIFTMGYFISIPVKSAWDKLPPAPCGEGYVVRLKDDGSGYDLCKRTPQGRILPCITVKASFRNEVVSLVNEAGVFVAQIRRMDFPALGSELKKATVRADNLQELTGEIERIFQSWDNH